MSYKDKDYFQENTAEEKEELESQIRKLTHDIGSAKNIIETLQGRQRAFEEEIAECADVNPIAARTYKTKLKDLTDEIDALKKQVESNKNKKKKLQDKLNSLKDTVNTNDSKNKDSSDNQKEEKGKASSDQPQSELHQDFNAKNDEQNKRVEEFKYQEIKYNKSFLSEFRRLSEEEAEYKRNSQGEQANSQTSSVKPHDLLNDDNLPNSLAKLRLNILFVATFFPNLSKHDFESVLLYVIENQEVVDRTTKEVIDKDGEKHSEISEEVKKITELWSSSDRDKLLRDCCLKPILLEDGSRVIGFISTSLSTKLKDYFEENHGMYLEEQFKRVKFLLFHSSSKVAISSIDISVDMALSNPEIYGEPWLRDILELLYILDVAEDLSAFGSKLKDYWIQLLIGDQKLQQQKEANCLSTLIEKIERNQRKRFLSLRLSFLLSQMLDNSHLSKSVDVFLSWALKKKRYQDDVLGYQDDVLEIIKPLYTVPNFNQLYWVKQLIDRGRTKEVRDKAHYFLYSRIEQHSDHLYETLGAISDWLPNSNRLPEDYSRSNEFSLRVLPEFAFYQLNSLSSHDYGKWPSEYILFREIEEKLMDEQVKLLVEWIFRDEINYIIGENFRDVEVFGSLIFQWFKILRGDLKQDPIDKNKTLLYKLLKSIKSFLASTKQRDIVDFWNDLAYELLEEADLHLESDNESERKKAIRERNFLRELKKEFKAI